MQRFSAYSRILATGAPAPSATITVYFPAGTLNLASIFSDDGVTPLANPFTATADGLINFYAADGDYDIRLSGGGIVTPYTWGDVTLWSGVGGAHTWTGVQTFSTPIAIGSGGTGLNAAPTNGQLLIGSGGTAFVLSTLTGTANQVVVTNGAGSITLSLPQSIAAASSPTFADLTLSSGLVVGFAGAVVADQVQVGDATFIVDYNTGNPRVLFDTNDSLRYTRATDTLEILVGAVAEVTVTASGLQVTDGLNVGFSAAPTADTVAIGDATYLLDYNAGDPRVTFDTNDRLEYARATNTLSFIVGGTTEAIFTAAGLQVINGLNVGFSGTPGDDQVQVGDASFIVNYNAGTPTINFDTGDSFYYNRGTNTHEWAVGSVVEMLLSASGLAITNGLVVGFSGTPGDDEVRVGDANFGLDFLGGGADTPSINFDSGGDGIFYSRLSNIMSFVGSGGQLTLDLGSSPMTLSLGINPAPMLLRMANGSSGAIQFRNAANSAWLAMLTCSTGNDLQLGDGTNDVQFMLPLVALGGGAAPTLGTIGGTGPAAAGQNTWARFLDSAGAAYFVPVWK